MKINIKLIGNDIELDGIKVARVFDLSGTVRSQLEEAIDIASGINLELDKIKEQEYDRGHEKGYEEGWQKGYDEGYLHEI
jgi:flagellar biosynthesis/type III secretory pathway protein FliH